MHVAYNARTWHIMHNTCRTWIPFILVRAAFLTYSAAFYHAAFLTYSAAFLTYSAAFNHAALLTCSAAFLTYSAAF